MMKKLAILALLPLSACISFGAKPPKSLLTLQAAATVPVGRTQSSGDTPTITIVEPVVPRELAVQRVPVHSGGNAIAYVADAQWVELPAQLFARLLSDTITARTGRVVLSTREFQIDPGARLAGELRSFGVDADRREAVVVFDASLVRGKEPAIEKRRFEARVPVATIEGAPVAAALNRAANEVADEVADWIGK